MAEWEGCERMNLVRHANEVRLEDYEVGGCFRGYLAENSSLKPEISLEVVTGHTFTKLTFLLREYKNRGDDYQEFLQEKLDSANDSETISNEEIELFLEIMKFEDFLLEVLDKFYKTAKIKNKDDIYIHLVIFYIVCLKFSKMNETEIEELALKNYPLKWHKVLGFICQRKHHMQIANIAMKSLDIDFCNEFILEPLHSKLKWMKGLLKRRCIHQREKNKVEKTGKDINLKMDAKKECNKKKAYAISVEKCKSFEEEVDEYVYWTSLPKTYKTGQEDSLCFKQGMKTITERMNPLSTKREELVQLNNKCQLRKTKNHEELLNPDDKKGKDGLKYTMLSNVELEGNDTAPQKIGNESIKKEDEEEINDINKQSKKKANVTYMPSISYSVLNSSETEGNNLLSEKIQNNVSINLNSMQARFPKMSNTTTILREAALIQKNEERELRILQDLSQGGRDPLMWSKLQEELREKEKMERKESMEIKHLQALLWQEEAMLARRILWQKNKLEAMKLKNEKNNIIDMKRKSEEREELLKKSLIKNAQMTTVNAQKAVQKSRQAKKLIAKKMKEERKILLETIAQKKKEEEAAKEELKEKIKASCKPSSFPLKKTIDLTETPGWGFSCEMSIAELQERLHLQKIHVQQEIEERKKEVWRQHQQKQEYLEDIDKFLREYKEIKKQTMRSSNETQETKYPESKEIIKLKKLLEEKRTQKLLGNNM